MGLFKTYSYRKGAALSIGSTFIWKMLSFVNSVLIAYYFGTQTNSDIYFYILFLAGIIAIFFTSFSSSILIPQAIYLRKENEQKAQSLLNFSLLLYGIIFLPILGAGLFFPVDIFAFISEFPREVLIREYPILQIAFLYFASYIFCYLTLDIMYIYHIFSVNFLFPLNALLPLLIMILFHNILGLKSMLIGFTASYLIQIIVYLSIMKRKLNWSFKSCKINIEKRLKQNLITNQILIVINCFYSFISIYLLSNFAGGIISALSYAKQLTDTPAEILSSKIIGIYNIQLNENSSANDFKALNNNYLKVSYLLLFIMVPLSLFTCYFAPDIINLFFKRGKFDTQSSINVVKFLRPLILLLIINSVYQFSGSVISSTRKIKESFKYMLIRTIILVVFVYIAISYFGPFAYPYAEIFCAIIGYFISALFFKKHIPQIQFWQPLKDAVLLVSLNLIALIPAELMSCLLKGQNVFIRIFICGIIFLSTLALLYIPTKQFKKVLPSVLGTRYNIFLNKIPVKLKPFFI